MATSSYLLRLESGTGQPRRRVPLAVVIQRTVEAGQGVLTFDPVSQCSGGPSYCQVGHSDLAAVERIIV